jgi:HK97 family phage portal protein
LTLFGKLVSTLTKSHQERLPQTFGSYASSLTGGFGGGNQAAAMGAMGGVSWLFASINRISTSIASTEWQLFKKGPDGKKAEVFDHPAQLLLANPTPFLTTEDFIEVSQQHMELVGETWWVLVRNASGIPVEIWPIRPDRMRPIASTTDFIVGYIYTFGSQQIPLGIDDVIFMKQPNPLDPFRGMGVVQSLLVDLQGERMAAEWTRNFFRNDASPGGVIEYDHNLDDAQFAKLSQRWADQHKGVSNAHRVAIIEGGKWQDVKLTQRDMQFEQLRKLNRDTILGAFGIPLPIMGITESVNRANAEAAEVMYSRWVVRPRLRRFRGGFNKGLLPLYGVAGQTYEFGFPDPVPANVEQDTTRAVELYSKKVITKNEAREIVGFDSVDDGDDFAKDPAPMLPPGAPPGKSLRLATKGDDNDEYPDGVNEEKTAMEAAWGDRLETEMAEVSAGLTEGKSDDEPFEGADVDAHDWDWETKYGEGVRGELAVVYEESYPDSFEDEEGRSVPTAITKAKPGEVQRQAAEYASKRGAELLVLEGPLNLVETTRARVRSVVADAVGEGKSVGQVRKALQIDPGFSRARARLVARTETATALGQGQKAAAIDQGRDEKHWVSQGDGLVRPGHQSNETAGWMPIGDIFPDGQDAIQDPNCRCVVRYRTSELHQDSLETGLRQIVLEARCFGFKCNKLLGKNILVGTKLYCPRCKAERTIE